MVISDYLVNTMVEKNIISEDKEIYIYGLNNGFTILMNFITSLFLSYLIGKTNLLLFLLISFIPLRSYSGGIHCKSRILCYIYSNIIITFLLVIQDFFCTNITIFLIISFANFIYLFFTKTKGNLVRPLNNYEIVRYTKIKRIVLLLIISGGIILFLTEYFLYSTTVLTSINLSTSLVVMEKIKIEKLFNTSY
jgi:accessory gene regulator B